MNTHEPGVSRSHSRANERRGREKAHAVNSGRGARESLSLRRYERDESTMGGALASHPFPRRILIRFNSQERPRGARNTTERRYFSRRTPREPANCP